MNILLWRSDINKIYSKEMKGPNQKVQSQSNNIMKKNCDSVISNCDRGRREGSWNKYIQRGEE